MRKVTGYREWFDQAAASFGSEQFSSIMLKERVTKLNPKLDIRSDMVSRWASALIDEKKIEVTGQGPKGSLVFRVIGEIIVPKGVEAIVGQKEIESHVGSDQIRKVIKERFAQEVFTSASLREYLHAQYPSAPLSKIRGNIGYWLTTAIQSGEIEIATPEKKCQRGYRVPRKPEEIEHSAQVNELPAAHDEAIRAGARLIQDYEQNPTPATQIHLSPTDPTQALVLAFSAWMSDAMSTSVEAMKRAITEQTARFERLLTEVRVATIEELAASMPSHPKLFTAIQEIKREELPELTPKTPLPGKVSIYNMRYDHPFVDTYERLASNEKELMKKSIHLLANNGSHYPSLCTKKLDLEVPGTPRGAYVSRAGDLRFTWEKKGMNIEYFNLFRRGDAPLVYGAE